MYAGRHIEDSAYSRIYHITSSWLNPNLYLTSNLDPKLSPSETVSSIVWKTVPGASHRKVYGSDWLFFIGTGKFISYCSSNPWSLGCHNIRCFPVNGQMRTFIKGWAMWRFKIKIDLEGVNNIIESKAYNRDVLFCLQTSHNLID